MPLFFIPDSEYYSEYLVSLRNNYGIKVGKPQPDSSGNIAKNIVGVYIIDYERYLSDMEEKFQTTKGKGR